MGFWAGVIQVLVVVFAAFFAVVGVSFLVMPLTGTDKPIEGGPTWDKTFVGVAFLLAAGPLLVYAFSKKARGLPPPPKSSGPPAGKKA